MVIRRSAFNSLIPEALAKSETVLLPWLIEVNNSRSIAENKDADSINALLIFCSLTVSSFSLLTGQLA